MSDEDKKVKLVIPNYSELDRHILNEYCQLMQIDRADYLSNLVREAHVNRLGQESLDDCIERFDLRQQRESFNQASKEESLSEVPEIDKFEHPEP